MITADTLANEYKSIMARANKPKADSAVNDSCNLALTDPKQLHGTEGFAKEKKRGGQSGLV